MAKYNIYHGDFTCHECKADVKTIRSYPGEKRLTWMCPDRHVSVVDLNTKKKKESYEREERE
jgi:hypothetical protein